MGSHHLQEAREEKGAVGVAGLSEASHCLQVLEGMAAPLWDSRSHPVRLGIAFFSCGTCGLRDTFIPLSANWKGERGLTLAGFFLLLWDPAPAPGVECWPCSMCAVPPGVCEVGRGQCPSPGCVRRVGANAHPWEQHVCQQTVATLSPQWPEHSQTSVPSLICGLPAFLPTPSCCVCGLCDERSQNVQFWHGWQCEGTAISHCSSAWDLICHILSQVWVRLGWGYPCPSPLRAPRAPHQLETGHPAMSQPPISYAVLGCWK